jgi:hypothetical protein
MKKFLKKQLVKIREKKNQKKRMRKFKSNHSLSLLQKKELNLKKAMLKTKVQQKATKVRKFKENHRKNQTSE